MRQAPAKSSSARGPRGGRHRTPTVGRPRLLPCFRRGCSHTNPPLLSRPDEGRLINSSPPRAHCAAARCRASTTPECYGRVGSESSSQLAAVLLRAPHRQPSARTSSLVSFSTLPPGPHLHAASRRAERPPPWPPRGRARSRADYCLLAPSAPSCCVHSVAASEVSLLADPGGGGGQHAPPPQTTTKRRG